MELGTDCCWYAGSWIGEDMNRRRLGAIIAECLVNDRSRILGSQGHNGFTDMVTGTEIPAHRQPGISGECFAESDELLAHPAAKRVNRLVRITDDLHDNTGCAQPFDDLQVSRIAVLSFIDNHFSETRCQRSTKS